ncbi:MAG: type I phosphomannose isomerase catalytic subunit [Bacteroidales bacterium]
MNQLYPLKFKPQYKSHIWGGRCLESFPGKKIPDGKTAESWEISGVQGNISVVSNGFLKGNTLEELIEVYMGDLVGEKIYERFGIEFPLLIKFIDANDSLSVQVHPDDELARMRHQAYGKTEMWYVLKAASGASLISGFSKNVSRDEFLQYLNGNRLTDLLNSVDVKAGDVFFIPAGRVHSIGKGILLAEIQQTSDITYRIYDWGRKDAQGNSRQLHTDMALDAIDFNFVKNVKTAYAPAMNSAVRLAQCPYFTTHRIDFDQPYTPDYDLIDSFVIYICTEGACSIKYSPEQDPVEMLRGETVLLPADLRDIELIPKEKTSLLEVYIR